MNKLTIALIVLIILGVGGYFYLTSDNRLAVDNPDTDSLDTDRVPVETNNPTSDTDQQAAEPAASEDEPMTVLGTSAGGNPVEAYHFGNGEKEVLLVGGIHGAYSWNTILLMRQLVDYVEANPETVPSDVKLTIVPLMNPDGLQKVIGSTGEFQAADVPSVAGATIPGRFNANNVDLNRNFDCEWQTEGTWQDRAVSGGDAPFSEPEAAALRDYITANTPAAAIVYYSSAGGVFSSNCLNGVSEATADLTTVYADASGYREYQEFDFYEITGDMVNWMAKQDIPAISVLLTDHQNVEWAKNLPGVEAILTAVSDTATTE